MGLSGQNKQWFTLEYFPNFYGSVAFDLDFGDYFPRYSGFLCHWQLGSHNLAGITLPKMWLKKIPKLQVYDYSPQRQHEGFTDVMFWLYMVNQQIMHHMFGNLP